MKKAVIILMIVFGDIARRLFDYYPDANELFITSDGQAFKRENDAENHARYLDDKKVRYFSRDVVMSPSPLKVEQDGSEDEPEESPEEYRAKLEAEYEKLYGKKPVANMKTETFEARIAEKS